MRRYLYRKLSEYLSLYVRPDDRIVQITVKEPPNSLGLRSGQSLMLQRRAGEAIRSRADLKAIEKFRPDWVLLNGNIQAAPPFK